MRKQDILRRLENLSKEYNDLSSQLLTEDGQENVAANEPPGVNATKLAEYEATIEKLKKEAKENGKEIKFLKDILKRCNDQLNRHILRNGELSPYEIPRTETDIPEVTRQSVYKLTALLAAYDEVINEQQLTNLKLTEAIEDSFKKMKILEEENRKLHEARQIFDNEGYSESELRQIAEEAKVLVEERELLIADAKVLQEKQVILKRTYDEKLEKLESKLREEKNVSKSLKNDLKVRESDLQSLQEKLSVVEEELKNSVAEKDHKKSIAECSMYLEKLKEAYGSESSIMKKKVDAITVEKESLETRLSDSAEQIKGIKKEVGGYKTHLRKNHSLLFEQKKTIKALRISRTSCRAKLRNLSQVCSKLLEDRKRILLELKTMKDENLKFSQEAISKSAMLGRLTLKYKEDHLELTQRLAECEGKRKAAEEAWSKSAKDVTRVRRLLQSKEDLLKTVLSDLRFGFTRKASTLKEGFK